MSGEGSTSYCTVAVMLWYLVKRDLPLHVFARFFCLLVASLLIDWALSHRKERNFLAHSFGEPNQAHMMKSPYLKLIAPFGHLPQAGCTDLQPWGSCFTPPFLPVGNLWGGVGAYKMSSALSAGKA